jgi:hypothetical protein
MNKKPKELLEFLTSETNGFDREMWREQDSSCLLCHAPMALEEGAKWPEDNRLLLCWSCMSDLCEELLSKKQSISPK